MIRVHVLFEHMADRQPFATSQIRLLRPLSHPSITDAVRMTASTDLPRGPVDVVIVDRLWNQQLDVISAQSLVRRVRAMGARLVYALDDNLLDLRSLPLQGAFYTEGQRMVVRLLAREADALLLSTPPLAARFRALNPAVHVIANHVDEQLFGPPPALQTPEQGGPRLVMGYMGTATHLDDLLLILRPLRRVLRRHRDSVRLELVGISNAPHLMMLFDGLPVRVRSTGGRVGYPQFVAWMRESLRWQCGLAPLRDTLFNSAKSDLKFVDYAALGIPGIFSDTPSYRDTVRSGDNGLLVPNTDAAWEAALETMLGDAAARHRMAAAALDEARATRTLAATAGQWRDRLHQVMARPPRGQSDGV